MAGRCLLSWLRQFLPEMEKEASDAGRFSHSPENRH
jgi:hypothetical protein